MKIDYKIKLTINQMNMNLIFMKSPIYTLKTFQMMNLKKKKTRNKKKIIDIINRKH